MPFHSEGDASAKLNIVLHTLRSYDFNDPKVFTFLDTFNQVLRNMIYESETFDQYLSVSEYIKLRDISQRIREILGDSEILA